MFKKRVWTFSVCASISILFLYIVSGENKYKMLRDMDKVRRVETQPVQKQKSQHLD